MKRQHLWIAFIFCALTLLVSFAGSAATQQPGVQPEGAEILARGPVHEAFAQPTDSQPKPSPIVPKQPPDAVGELPPDQKPEGSNVQWIGGYWAWDDEANSFLWVSGCWRDVPPDKRWMPGHWQEVENGWMWVAGLWAPMNVQTVQYLPPPPPTLDVGPATPAPDAVSLYAPGCWVYRENRYLWRPGHWYKHQPHWVWVPAHYCWTPSGCLFVEDYWDHALEECGLLFAPCRFDLVVWARLRRPFIPDFCIHFDFLIGSLFVHAPSRHYFFGDFFEPRYVQRGFVAWTDFHPSPGIADPFFGYYRHLHAAEPKWEPALRDLYRARTAGEVARPPRTLTQQIQVVNNITVNKTANTVVNKNINITNVQNVTALAPLKEINNTKVTSLSSLSQVKKSSVPVTVVKTTAVTKEEHARDVKVATQTRELATQRKATEAKILSAGNVPVKHTDPPKAAKVTVPTPPPPVTKTPPAPAKKPPPPVVVPKHEEKAIPKYEPPKPPAPPKKDKKG